MRLNDDQVQAILDVAHELAGPEVEVRLFGSRVDDAVHGGNIDLLIDSPRPVERSLWLAALITARLQRRLGDRKVDVLLVDPSTPLEPVHLAARTHGKVVRR